MRKFENMDFKCSDTSENFEFVAQNLIPANILAISSSNE